MEKNRVEHGQDSERSAAARLLASIVDSSQDAIISTSPDGVIQSWNLAAERLFGWPADEIVGRPLALLIPPDRQDEERRIGERVRDGERVEHFETERVHYDGRLVPVSVTVSPIRDEAGLVTGASSIVRDETERREAQRAVRESEDQFRTLVEQVEDYAIFRIDPRGLATTWNEGVRRVLGFTETEFIGRDIVPSIFTPEDVRAGVPWRELAEAEAEGTASNDRWMRRRDGTRFYAAGVTTALRDETGHLLGFTKVMRDWTDRKLIEEALHRSELRYRRLFETAKDGILLVDAADGRVVEVNPLVGELLGLPPDALLGKSLAEIGLFRDAAASQVALRELWEHGEYRFDRLTVERAGQHRDVEVVASLYRENGSSLVQWNVRDVTERRRLEEQTRRQAAALSDLHRRKDEFLAMLSHELRNPLAPIANAVQLLRLERENETVIEHEARTIIERQVAQMSHLVDDLLEVSRITTGSFHLRRELVPVEGVVERALETARVLSKQRRQELTVRMPPEPLWVQGDPARLEQVLVNLLNNAVKYTEEGGHVSLMVQREGGWVALWVCDTGVGIAPELLPRIFDVFTQAERSLDRAEGGLGVGLSLVQRLVELHGGTVDVASEQGRGSEFVVRLPLAPEPPAADSSVSSAALRPPTPPVRVLVVDDNVDAAESLAMLLRARRHDVRTAHDGLAALEAANEYHPDVALLDIGLPGLDGFEVARRLRSQPGFENVVLVAMTGYGQDSDRQHSEEAGFDHHLVKPADFESLRRILAEVAARGRADG